MASSVTYVAAVVLLCLHACLGQFAGPGTMPMFGHPFLMSAALGGLDFNKLMHLQLMMNSMGPGMPGGLMLPAYGLATAFS